MTPKTLLGSAVDRSVPLGEGTSGAGTVLTRHVLADGREVVTKVARGAIGGLETEAMMLRTLAGRSSLPVPRVWHAEDRLLVMDYLPGGAPLAGTVADAAADAVAALHDVTAEAYGFETDTVIGPLRQQNAWSVDWHDFLAQRRLMVMATAAVDAGQAGQDLNRAVERLCTRLPDLLPDPGPPSLLHGDLWGGNVLCTRERLSGFIDPAIYFGDAEMDLAFGTLFGTLPPRFFDRYKERRALSPDFFERRRDLYNLWPLLVHVRLFGGGYLAQTLAILNRYAG